MAQQPTPVYEFGPFHVDPVERVLRRQGEPIPLTSKVFDILLLLVEQHGHVVEKQQLMRTIWPDTFVEEGNLTQNISVLRKILGAGEPGHEYIQTVPRRGYRFVGSVRETNGDIELIVEEHSKASIVIEEDDGHPPADLTNPAPIGKAKSLRMAFLPATMVLFVVSIAGGFLWQHFRLRTSAAAPAFSLDSFEWQKLSADDRTGGMISPDGEFLVFQKREADGSWTFKQRRLASLETITIVNRVTSSCWGMTLSHDSSFLYYILADESQDTGTLYRVSVLGGTPKRIVDHANGGPTLSPDDSRVAFIRFRFKPGVSALITANAFDGSEERVLEESDNGPELFNPAWSPDGSRIVCSRVDKRADGNHWSLVEIPAGGGSPTQFGNPTEQHLWWHGWLPDGSGVLTIATDPVTAKNQLYVISYPDGSMRRVTHDLNSYIGISLSKDQTRLVTNHSERTTDIWTAPANEPGKATKTTACCAASVVWTPNGRIVYDTVQEGKRQLWIMDGDGSHQQQLSPETAVDWSPSVSDDGRYVAFLSKRSGRTEIWRADLDGRNAQRLTDVGPDLSQPQIAADGRVVYFSQYKIGKWVIERISTEGGEPEQVSDVSVDLWSISPDGKRVAYSFFDEKLGRWQIAVRALEGNDSIVQLDVAAYDLLTWTPDSNSLIYKDATSPELSPPLWRQPLNGDKPQPFIAATPETNYWLDWSSDRKQLAFVRGREVINMVMLTRSDRVAKLSGH
jgi:DNA-binding winged helix-turn-helix (wHTH) protein/Tol biopolymer transport system component